MAVILKDNPPVGIKENTGTQKLISFVDYLVKKYGVEEK